MSSQPRSMAANTKAGRRNGSFKRSQQAIHGRHQRNKGSAQNYPREERKRDCRIYTVKVSTRDGTAIYKAWEHTDNDMDNHFRDSEQRFFSFTDVRGKTLHNVDVNSGWRYKMTLRWNPHKAAHDGSNGDWQDLRQWYHEREQRGEQPVQKYQKPYASPQHSEEKKVPEMTQQFLASQEMFPKLTVVYKPEGEKGTLVTGHAHDGPPNPKVNVEEGEEKEEDTAQKNIDALEAEKAELLGMLSSAK